MSVNNTRELPDVKSKNLKIYLKNTLDKIIFSLGLEMYKYLQIPKNLIKSIFKKMVRFTGLTRKICRYRCEYY